MDSVDELAQFINAAKRTCSFDAETPVATDEGSIPIREVDVGDRVLAWHETLGREPTGRGYYTVTDAYTNVHEVLVYLTINGEEISTTPEHPFYVVDSAALALSMAEGWLATGETQGWWIAGELYVGDAVRQADGTTGSVQAR